MKMVLNLRCWHQCNNLRYVWRAARTLKRLAYVQILHAFLVQCRHIQLFPGNIRRKTVRHTSRVRDHVRHLFSNLYCFQVYSLTLFGKPSANVWFCLFTRFTIFVSSMR